MFIKYSARNITFPDHLFTFSKYIKKKREINIAELTAATDSFKNTVLCSGYIYFVEDF